MSMTESSQCVAESDPILAAHGATKRHPSRPLSPPSPPRHVSKSLDRVKTMIEEQGRRSVQATEIARRELAAGERSCSSCEEGWLKVELCEYGETREVRCALQHDACDYSRRLREEWLETHGFGEAHRNVSLDELRQEQNREIVRDYLELLGKAVVAGIGMWIEGPKGTGKTSLLKLIAERAFEVCPAGLEHVKGAPMNLYEFWSKENRPRVRRMRKCTLLLIDDLNFDCPAKQKNIIGWQHDLIDARAEYCRSTVITTNRLRKELIKAAYREYHPMVDRLTDATRAHVVELSGASWRQQ